MKETKALYAMKVLRKDVIINTDQIESTRIEKEILKSVCIYIIIIYPPNIFSIGPLSIPSRFGICIPNNREDIFCNEVLPRGGAIHPLIQRKAFPREQSAFLWGSNSPGSGTSPQA